MLQRNKMQTPNLESKVETYINWLDTIHEGETKTNRPKGSRDINDPDPQAFHNRMERLYTEMKNSQYATEDPVIQRLIAKCKEYMSPNNEYYRASIMMAYGIIRDTLIDEIGKLREEINARPDASGGRRRNKRRAMTRRRKGRRGYKNTTRKGRF
jgi:hypothetical protein